MIHFKCFVLVDPVVGVVALLAILVVALLAILVVVLFGSNFGALFDSTPSTPTRGQW